MIDVRVKPKDKTDWGGILSTAGMVAGAVAAPFTGGASLSLTGALAAAGTGAALGGAAGKLAGSGIDAAHNSGPEKTAVKRGDAIQRRLDTQVNAGEHIQNAISLVGSLPSALQAQYGPPLTKADPSQFRVTNQDFQYSQPRFEDPYSIKPGGYP